MASTPDFAALHPGYMLRGTFAHAWALKHWRMRELCTLEQYIDEGLDLLLGGLLTRKGRRQYRKLRARRKSAKAEAA